MYQKVSGSGQMESQPSQEMRFPAAARLAQVSMGFVAASVQYESAEPHRSFDEAQVAVQQQPVQRWHGGLGPVAWASQVA